ncbi:sulfatase [Echinicola strongylocentroti]|uniref:Sulfatase n=1 Tax=Echinicola strongylocentroti TaxID=1795355 RepID=A0A2Z4IPZ7_9BACT|nr:sulfatase-like hydrolase/transferase [Echinicola strongylocentroti]AWW32840.1 sulfatase [Echinicola strongylocentroti]
MNKVEALGILGLVLVIACFTSCKGEKTNSDMKTSGQKNPNIVLILSDDQAWTDYGFMGHEHIETPNIDRLAEESHTFTRGYVPTSLCSPSLASLITGLYPQQNGILGNDRILPTDDPSKKKEVRGENFKPLIKQFEKFETLPDLLKPKGYLSFQTGKWWIGNYKNGGFDKGMTHGDISRGGRHGDEGLKIGRNGMDPVFKYIDEAVEKKKPFFMWYAPMMPHGPHTPPDSLYQKYLKKTPSKYVAKYWAMCEWFDITCGQLMDYVDNKGLTDNTIFIYVCDNGWVQNEDNASYDKVSKRAPYDLGMRTPIMIKWQGQIKPLMDTSSIVSSIDIVPTVLSLLDLEKTEKMEGIDFLDQQALDNRETIYGEIYDHDFYSTEEDLFYNIVYQKPYKLIVPNKKNKPNEKIELYDIFQDPYEENEISEAHPQLVETLTKKAIEFRN